MALINPRFPQDHPRNDPRNYPVSIQTYPPVPDEKIYQDPEFAVKPDPRMGTWEDWTNPRPSQSREFPEVSKLPNVTKGMPDFANGDLMTFIAQLLKQLQSMGVQLPKPPTNGMQGLQGLQGMQGLPGMQQGQRGLPGSNIADQIMERIGSLSKLNQTPY